MIKPLTSLRFFFAVAVFFSHLGFMTTNKGFKFFFEKFFEEGFLGVSFFFILSGFILSYTYNYNLITKKTSNKIFYLARFARIYPLHIFTALLMIPLSAAAFKEKIGYHIFLLQSFFSDPKIHFSVNSPSWSISDEAFFYLLFPILIWAFHKFRFLIFLAPVLMVSIIFILNFFLPESLKHYWLYISPPIRLFDFILGILLYFLYDKLSHHYKNLKINSVNFVELGSVFFFIVVFIFHKEFSINYRYSIYYWLPMVIVILTFALSASAFNSTGGFISNLLSKRFFVYMGEISFAFYLLHKIVIHYYKTFSGIINYRIFDLLFIFSITFIASIIAYEFLEKPCNKLIKNIFVKRSI